MNRNVCEQGFIPFSSRTCGWKREFFLGEQQARGCGLCTFRGETTLSSPTFRNRESLYAQPPSIAKHAASQAYHFFVPIHYRIDPERRRIWTSCIGAVNPKEIRQHFRDLARDPNRPDRLNVLLDLTEMTSLPETAQLRAVSNDLKRYQPNMQFDACAIVASRNVLFGMMRMFQALARNSFTTTQVFRTAADAETWLAAQETEPQGRN